MEYFCLFPVSIAGQHSLLKTSSSISISFQKQKGFCLQNQLAIQHPRHKSGEGTSSFSSENSEQLLIHGERMQTLNLAEPLNIYQPFGDANTSVELGWLRAQPGWAQAGSKLVASALGELLRDRARGHPSTLIPWCSSDRAPFGGKQYQKKKKKQKLSEEAGSMQPGKPPEFGESPAPKGAPISPPWLHRAQQDHPSRDASSSPCSMNAACFTPAPSMPISRQIRMTTPYRRGLSPSYLCLPTGFSHPAIEWCLERREHVFPEFSFP